MAWSTLIGSSALWVRLCGLPAFFAESSLLFSGASGLLARMVMKPASLSETRWRINDLCAAHLHEIRRICATERAPCARAYSHQIRTSRPCAPNDNRVKSSSDPMLVYSLIHVGLRFL